MMVPPSGKVIDLSADRSKYHALRQQGVDPAVLHRRLYPLVDIIYRRLDDSGKPKRGMTEYDYEFSGYTLDTVFSASDWSEADKAALSSWLQQDEQIRRIHNAVAIEIGKYPGDHCSQLSYSVISFAETLSLRWTN